MHTTCYDIYSRYTNLIEEKYEQSENFLDYNGNINAEHHIKR